MKSSIETAEDFEQLLELATDYVTSLTVDSGKTNVYRVLENKEYDYWHNRIIWTEFTGHTYAYDYDPNFPWFQFEPGNIYLVKTVTKTTIEYVRLV